MALQGYSENKRCIQHEAPGSSVLPGSCHCVTETIINLDEAQETLDLGTFSPKPSHTTEPQLGNINNFQKWIAVQHISSCQHLENCREWPGNWDMKIKESNHMEFLSYQLSCASPTPPHYLSPNEENINSETRGDCFISFVKIWGQWDYEIPELFILMSQRPLFILCLHSVI